MDGVMPIEKGAVILMAVQKMRSNEKDAFFYLRNSQPSNDEIKNQMNHLYYSQIDF